MKLKNRILLSLDSIQILVTTRSKIVTTTSKTFEKLFKHYSLEKEGVIEKSESLIFSNFIGSAISISCKTSGIRDIIRNMLKLIIKKDVIRELS